LQPGSPGFSGSNSTSPLPTSHQRLRRRSKKTEAERELTACLIAVKEVHGPHSVKMAAEHWIEALDEIFLSNMNRMCLSEGLHFCGFHALPLKSDGSSGQMKNRMH